MQMVISKLLLNLVMKARLFKCKVFVKKISFHSYANKTNFHMKSFVLSLAFITRFKATRKWPILRGKSARVTSPIGRFYTRGRLIRLDEFGQTFVVRLVIRL